MARTSVQDTIWRIRRQLRGGQRPELVVAAEALDATDVGVTLGSLPADLEVGSELSIDLEVMLVNGLLGGSAVNVQRGWLDSDATTHANGATVLVDPRFSNFDIFDALRDEILSWGPSLYRVADDTISAAAGDMTLELPVGWLGAYGIIDLRRGPAVGDSFSSNWPTVPFRFQRGTVAWDGASTSGMLIRFTEGYVNGGPLHVMVALPFITSALTWTADLVTDVKLTESMIDIAVMGTQLRLLGDDENAQSNKQSQAQPRRDEETQGTAQRQQLMQLLYRRRRSEEEARLQRLYPIRQS